MSGQVTGTEGLRKGLMLLWGTTITFLIVMGAVLVLVELDPTLRLLLIGAMITVVVLEIAATLLLLYGQWKTARDGKT